MAEDDNKDTAADALQKLLDKKNGDMAGVAAQLMSENYNTREKNRTLKAEIETLKGKLPAEDAVVLSKTDVEKFDAWKALGKFTEVKAKLEEADVYAQLGKVDEIKAGLAERDTLKTEVAATKRDQLLRDVAEVEGWNYLVLKRLAGNDLPFEIKEGKDDKGQPKRSASVIIKSGDKTETRPAAEYADAEWNEFLPSLKVSEKQEPNKGTQYVKQPGAASQPANKEQIVKQEREKLQSAGSYEM